jgi:hypothetical protein
VRIIPRAEWGARHDNGAGPAPLPAGEVWLHHSVTAAANGTAIIRDIEAVGETRFGTGISYTWLVTPNGSIYEGHSPNRLGTHTGGRNSIARAICWVGNYDVAMPTVPQVQATAWLLQEAHRRGWIRVARLNGGHRDLKATACPGKHAYALIAEINRLAARPPIMEDDMPLTDPMRPYFPGWPEAIQAMTAGSTFANTFSHARGAEAAALRTEAKLAALAGQLTNNQATLLAAISDDETQVTLSPEQMELLLAGVSDATARGLFEALKAKYEPQEGGGS